MTVRIRRFKFQDVRLHAAFTTPPRRRRLRLRWARNVMIEAYATGY
jgi:hypothetical protein